MILLYLKLTKDLLLIISFLLLSKIQIASIYFYLLLGIFRPSSHDIYCLGYLLVYFSAWLPCSMSWAL